MMAGLLAISPARAALLALLLLTNQGFFQTVTAWKTYDGFGNDIQ
jgi:hypothetical protein